MSRKERQPAASEQRHYLSDASPVGMEAFRPRKRLRLQNLPVPTARDHPPPTAWLFVLALVIVMPNPPHLSPGQPWYPSSDAQIPTHVN